MAQQKYQISGRCNIKLALQESGWSETRHSTMMRSGLLAGGILMRNRFSPSESVNSDIWRFSGISKARKLAAQ